MSTHRGILAAAAGVLQTRYGKTYPGAPALARAFVKSGRLRTALGVDVDSRTLAAATCIANAELEHDARRRLRFQKQSVLARARKHSASTSSPPTTSATASSNDAAAWTCSARAHASLARGGMFFLDVFGGLTAEQPSLETHDYRRLHVHLGAGLVQSVDARAQGDHSLSTRRWAHNTARLLATTGGSGGCVGLQSCSRAGSFALRCVLGRCSSGGGHASIPPPHASMPTELDGVAWRRR